MPDGTVRALIRDHHIQGLLPAALLWEWVPLLPPACPIAATTPPKLPSARARTRIPRTTRVRTGLGDLRCADNLRCAPPAGPLEGVPFHNEVRVSIGEGPLIDDMDIGSSRTEKLLLCGCRYLAFELSAATSPAHARAACPHRVSRSHTSNTSIDSDLWALSAASAAGGTGYVTAGV